MSVTSAIVGDGSPSSFAVTTEVTGTSTRLAVDTVPIDPLSPSIVYYGPVVPSPEGIARITATGLDSDTLYYWAVEDDAVLDTGSTGQAWTDPTPGSPASFIIGAASCAGSSPDYPDTTGTVLASDRVSNSIVFATLAARAVNEAWRRWLGMGDMHYDDLGSGLHGIVGGASLANYRRSYTDVLAQANQHLLYRSVASMYKYDDHDFGPDNSDETSPGRANAIQAYTERWPYTPPPGVDPATDGLFESTQLGRVLVVMLDVRSNRDPNEDPQTPEKTMLGAGQRAWLETLLSTSTAEALILVSGSQWEHPGGSDTWASFQHERDWLVDLLGAPGGGIPSWLPRMVLAQGDAHSAGIRSGDANPWGNFPVFQFSALDSTPTGEQSWKDVLSVSERGLYGTLTVTDDGTTITITGTVYQDSTALGSYAIAIDTTPPAPAPPTDPTPVPGSVAEVSDEIRWYACDLASGAKIAYLPMVTGGFGRALSTYTQATLTLPIPLDGPGALGPLAWQVLQAPSTMYVAVVNGVPAWGGMLLKPVAGSDAIASLGLISLEGYLARRYVGDHVWVDTDEALIAAGLVADAQEEGIGLVVDAPLTGTLRSRTYHDDENAFVLSRLQELAEVEGGPQWTIDLEWTDSRMTHVRKVFRLRSRIGRTTPIVTLSSTAEANATYDWTLDYSHGRGANDIMAYSSGEGTDRPTSSRWRAETVLAAGVPRFEYRWQPSSSIKKTSVLDEHARRKLFEIASGTETVAMTCRWDADNARLGVDWNLGDTVRASLTGHFDPVRRLVTGRVLGYDMDPEASTVTPQLLLEA